MAKNDNRKLTCGACKHENEIERVYCHNCGEKLDRSLVPQLNEMQSDEEKAKIAKKVKRQMNPNRFNWLQTTKTFVLIELFAVSVAAVFLAVQAPDDVPSAKDDALPNLAVRDVWSGMMSARPSVAVTFKEDDVNSYLRKAVKGAEGPLGTKFERAFVHFEPGLITISTQRDVWDLAIYNSVTFKPSHDGGKWKADIQRVGFGKIKIPGDYAKMVKLDEVVLGSLAQVFEKEIKQLDRLDRVEPADATVLLVTKPAQ